MVTLWIIIAVAVIGAAVIIYLMTRKKNVEETPQVINQPQPQPHQIVGSSGKLKSIDSGTWYMCTDEIKPYEAGIVYLGADIDPAIKMWERYFREATKEEIEEQHPTPEPEPTPEPTPEPKPTYDAEYESYLDAFSPIVKISRHTENYRYMKLLYDEACAQYFGYTTLNGLPKLLKADNFPSLTVYGDIENEGMAFDTLIGFLFAMHLAELMPKSRTALGKIGYELGRYDRYSNIYGYSYDSDPNNMRLMAGVLYAAMRGTLNPDTDAMRKEVCGTKYEKTLTELASGTRIEVGENDFFTDLREFMPTAPAPYAPNYSTRPDKTYPYEPRDEYGNLKVDRDVHEAIVRTYNLDSQDAVQAIADKEGEKEHLFGEDRYTEQYHFKPVFGKDVLGVTIDPESNLGKFASAVFSASNSARGILQAANITPVQYGRLRPACSWEQEACKNSSTDDRRNALVEVEIEDNDGCKDTPNTFGHYDKDGYWVYTQTEKDQYAETQKNTLYANSYPSGHSAGIMGVALLLIELFPQRADKILEAAVNFSLSRSKARYHWLSDIINGRVLGTWQNAISHAAGDYDELLKNVKM